VWELRGCIWVVGGRNVRDCAYIRAEACSARLATLLSDSAALYWACELKSLAQRELSGFYASLPY